MKESTKNCLTIFIFVLLQQAVNGAFYLKSNHLDKEWSLIEELNGNFTTPSCGRIVSGERVTFGQKPFQIALFYRGKFICGGSLISQKHVLTAAHCVVGKQARDMKIHYGTIKYSSGVPNLVEKIAMHPGYNPEDNLNDIAMLRLRDIVRTFTNVTKISMNLYTSTGNLTDIVQVSGWGRIGPYLPVSEELLVTNLTLVERNECEKRWKIIPKVRISEGVLCASDSGPKSACRGDSGGPLTNNINGVETLIGVVSLGASNCYSADLPNIFTNVFYYREWIASMLR